MVLVALLETPLVEAGALLVVELKVQGSLRPRHSSWSHSSRASCPSTQKKKKMKKPWREVNIVKRYWNASDADDMVNAPNTHDSPKRNMIPKLLMSNRLAVLDRPLSFTPNFFVECITSTLITTTKTTELKKSTARIGTRKAP